jgi:hypothetical protein
MAKKKPSGGRGRRGQYGRGRPKVFGSRIPKGARRFKLPRGGRTIYATADKYPRLFQWIINADSEDSE